VRAGSEQFDDQRAARVEQMLTIVEHQQDGFLTEEPHQQIHGGPSGLIGQTERARNRHRCQSRVGDRGQIDIPDTIRELTAELRSDFYAKPSLARTAGAGQRHQPVTRDKLPQLDHLILAPNETRQLSRKLVRRRCLADPKRGKFTAHIRVA